MQRLSITYKLTALLALLSTAPLTFLVFNRSSSEIVAVTRARLGACEQLGLSCALQLKHQDYRAIETLLDQFMQRTGDIAAVRLVRFDGLVIHQLGAVPEFSQDEQFANTAKHISVPILRVRKNWGNIEAVFENDPASEHLWRVGEALLATLSLNLLTFGLLLRRSLAVLDSGSAVPKRVRNTLDTIVGGVVILDANAKIVMANEAFQTSCKRSMDALLGTSLQDIPFRCEQPLLPWDQATADKSRQSGATLFLEDGPLERCFVVNATPIFDAKDAVAGTLVSFEDVTNLEQQKQSLLLALSELETSKDQIHQQNLRLQELASRDVLTGAFNRRSLYSDMEAKEALTIGHLTERTMHAFEAQDAKVLAESLEKMAKAGEHYDLPAIRHLATELKQVIGDARTNDWSFAAPLLRDLLDMCLMVQRAHIRDVASRPQDVDNCPQSSYFSTARSWWEADQV